MARGFEAARANALAAAAHPGSTRTELQRHSGLMNAIVAVSSQQAPDAALPSL